MNRSKQLNINVKFAFVEIFFVTVVVSTNLHHGLKFFAHQLSTTSFFRDRVGRAGEADEL